MADTDTPLMHDEATMRAALEQMFDSVMSGELEGYYKFSTAQGREANDILADAVDELVQLREREAARPPRLAAVRMRLDILNFRIAEKQEDIRTCYERNGHTNTDGAQAVLDELRIRRNELMIVAGMLDVPLREATQ